MTNEQVFNQVTIYQFTGKDTFAFLNNQLISKLNPGEAVKYSAICNPKGRIIFSLLIFPDENGVKIAVDTELSDNFYHYVNLRKFRMDLAISQTQETLSLSKSSDQVMDLQSLSISTQKVDQTNNDYFWNFMFEQGLPWINAKTTEMFIPQHVNLDQKNAIDFDKGCYPGQEIIARLHYIGKVKKRMTLMQFDQSQTYQAGEKVTIDGVGQDLEICSPVIKFGTIWRAQIITKNK